MFVSSTSVNLDLTPKGLFPNKEDAAQNSKCIIIAEVIQQLTKTSDLSAVTQTDLRNHAEKRYVDLSQENRLSLHDVDHKAFLLYQKGILVETAKKYYSFRLSEVDAKKWEIAVLSME